MMAFEESYNRKCFTFIWKLENVSFCLPNDEGYFVSPKFLVDKLHWTLEIPIYNDNLEMCLQRHDENGEIEIDCEFAILSSDGRVLQSWEDEDVLMRPNGFVVTSNFIYNFILNEVFFARRSVFLPHNTLTARCRIWKSAGTKFSKDVQCFARSRVVVEKRSFLWKVENFSNLKCNEEQTFDITSINSGKELISLKLFLTGGRICDETIRVKIIPEFENITVATIKLSILDAFKNQVKCFEDEFMHEDICEDDKYFESKEFILFHTKRELLENKSTYLPNDVLSLWCECAFSDGTVLQEIEIADSDCSAVAKKESDKHSLNETNNVPVSRCILDNFKSMLNNSCLSDVKLRTKSKTYPAHMSILGARSPVFKSMFSNDMLVKIKGCVEIEDLEEDTVLRLLRYIYSAEVEDLDWESATELYKAADKYQISSLKEKCSSYLKRNLCSKNVCEALKLADLHKDKDLKGCVQDYILRHGKDIINSEAWDRLMETNWKLAAETMRLKFKE